MRPPHGPVWPGIFIDGVNSEAVRRAHMRDLTTARQVVERGRTRVGSVPPTATTADRQIAQQTRTTAADAALFVLETAPQTWLHEQETPPDTESTP